MTQCLSMKNWSLEGDLEAKRYKHVLEAEVSAVVTAANRERKARNNSQMSEDVCNGKILEFYF